MRIGSPPREFDLADLWSAVKVGLLISAGVLLTHLESFVSETDFGVWTGLIAATAAVAIQAARLWLKDNTVHVIPDDDKDGPPRLPLTQLPGRP